jgi:predicted RNA-binding Zn-ribbon protein involved in translation (DUF1610 family)
LLYGYYISNVFAESPTTTTAIEILQDYKDKLKSTEEIHNFNDDLMVYCLDHFVCPECGDELHIKLHQEHREYQGGNCCERISDTLKCENCGYSYNLDD